MRALIEHVLQEEKAELTPAILQKLIKASEGIARKALMLLERIIDSDKGEQERVLLDASPEVTSRDGIRDLCGILVRESSRTEQNSNWEDIRKILNRLNSPAEEIRKVIMEYMADFLLQATSEAEREKAIRIIDDFSKGSRNFDKASLVKICYQATHEFEDEGEDCSE
jgi:DNA polymerase III gamma/tau subunit